LIELRRAGFQAAELAARLGDAIVELGDDALELGGAQLRGRAVGSPRGLGALLDGGASILGLDVELALLLLERLAPSAPLRGPREASRELGARVLGCSFGEIRRARGGERAHVLGEARRVAVD